MQLSSNIFVNKDGKFCFHDKLIIGVYPASGYWILIERYDY